MAVAAGYRSRPAPRCHRDGCRTAEPIGIDKANRERHRWWRPLPEFTAVPAAGLCLTTMFAGAVEVVSVLTTGFRPALTILERAADTSSPTTSGTARWCWSADTKTVTVLPAGAMAPRPGCPDDPTLGTDGGALADEMPLQVVAMIFCLACCVVRLRPGIAVAGGVPTTGGPAAGSAGGSRLAAAIPARPASRAEYRRASPQRSGSGEPGPSPWPCTTASAQRGICGSSCDGGTGVSRTC